MQNPARRLESTPAWAHPATIALLIVLLMLVAGCAPGNARWQGENPPANFWAGLWHGIIVVVTFIASLFTRDVGIYETHNVGWAYNLGFILGCAASLGGAIRYTRHRRRGEPDWEKLGRQLAAGIRAGLREHDTTESTATLQDAHWDELCRRIEEKVKEVLRQQNRTA